MYFKHVFPFQLLPDLPCPLPRQLPILSLSKQKQNIFKTTKQKLK